MGRRTFAPRIWLALGGLILVMAMPSNAAADPRGVFVTRCAYSHSLKDDPILHAGDPGASHRHDFFASTTTNANSTVSEMRRSPTTCRFDRDTAGYWFPTAYMGQTRVVPTFSKAYYFGVARSTVEPIPPGLQLVGGNAAATVAAQNPHASWSCGRKGERASPRSEHSYDCTGYASRWRFVDGVVARVELPSCWDGAGLEPTHLAYPDGRSCPPGYEHRLPVVKIQVHLGILNPCAPHVPCGTGGTGAGVKLRLASGPFYTLHADFWNTWRQAALERLTERCLNAHISCGFISNS